MSARSSFLFVASAFTLVAAANSVACGKLMPGGTITEPILCGGSQSLDFSNRIFQIQSGTAITAGGSCKLTLTNCTITVATLGTFESALSVGGSANVTLTNTTINAPLAITAGGSANVALVNSTLNGAVGIDAGGSAHVKGTNSTVNGQVKHGGSATIEGIAGVTGATPQAMASAAAAGAKAAGGCDGYADCYSKAGFSGQVTTHMVVETGADGHAKSATYGGGNAPKPVQACMIAVGKTKSVAGGGAGELRCDFAGTIVGGSSEITSAPSFTPAK